MPKRLPVSAAERVQISTEWLYDHGIPANVIYRDGGAWAIAGQNFPQLPAVLRAIADRCEAMLEDNDSVN